MNGPRLAVLGSGKGSNFVAIANAIDEGTLDAKIVLVVSDVEDAPILRLATERGIPAHYVMPGQGMSRLERRAEVEIIDLLKQSEVDLVILAGFMRIVGEPLLDTFRDRILNIHPSLLPQFRGLSAWRQALKAGVKETGCTVHVAESKVDRGPILRQARVPVLPDDTEETLFARIQTEEHRIYPETIGEYWKTLRDRRP